MAMFMYLFQKKIVNPITFILHTDNKLKGNRKEEKIAELEASSQVTNTMFAEAYYY